LDNADYVFAYGRLRTGFWHQFLLGRRTPVGSGRTSEKYALYASPFPYVRMDQPVSPIRGEVYAVNARILRDMDSLMCCPAWYRRCEVLVVLDNGPQVTAWMYERRGTGGILVEAGDLWDRAEAVAEPD